MTYLATKVAAIFDLVQVEAQLAEIYVLPSKRCWVQLIGTLLAKEVMALQWGDLYFHVNGRS